MYSISTIFMDKTEYHGPKELEIHRDRDRHYYIEGAKMLEQMSMNGVALYLHTRIIWNLLSIRKQCLSPAEDNQDLWPRPFIAEKIGKE